MHTSVFSSLKSEIRFFLTLEEFNIDDVNEIHEELYVILLQLQLYLILNI